MDETRRLEIIEGLNRKITKLEKKREYIEKGFYHKSELININSAIREIKRKIKLLEKSEGSNIPYEWIKGHKIDSRAREFLEGDMEFGIL